MESKPFPSNLFKIIPAAPPTPLPHSLPFSNLDQQDGFIHTSTAERIPSTTQLFFADAKEIWVLKLSSKALQHEDGVRLVWEGPEGCVHIYLGVGVGVGAVGEEKEKEKAGVALPRLGRGNVLSVKKYERPLLRGGWDDVFAKQDGWLNEEEED